MIRQIWRKTLGRLDPALVLIMGLPIWIFLLVWGALFSIDIATSIALRPMAQELGTSPSKAAITEYVLIVLEENKGKPRDEVHQVLNEIGNFRYPPQFFYVRNDGTMMENAIWDLAELPFGGKAVLRIGLFYDAEGRLVDAESGS